MRYKCYHRYRYPVLLKADLGGGGKVSAGFNELHY